MEQVNIGIIGGSGLYQMPELQNVREVEVDTPFGKPSDAFIFGELEGVTVAFLPRHARGRGLKNLHSSAKASSAMSHSLIRFAASLVIF